MTYDVSKMLPHERELYEAGHRAGIAESAEVVREGHKIRLPVTLHGLGANFLHGAPDSEGWAELSPFGINMLQAIAEKIELLNGVKSQNDTSAEAVITRDLKDITEKIRTRPSDFEKYELVHKCLLGLIDKYRPSLLQFQKNNEALNKELWQMYRGSLEGKIKAIKHARVKLGCGLREAKDYVDRLLENGPNNVVALRK